MFIDKERSGITDLFNFDESFISGACMEGKDCVPTPGYPPCCKDLKKDTNTASLLTDNKSGQNAVTKEHNVETGAKSKFSFFGFRK